MRRITIGLFLWISVLTAGPAAACDAECQFHSGRWQLQAGNRAYALRLFQGLADKGHAGAKFELGGMYLRGNGVTRNRTKAVELFLAAARLGHERGLEFYAKYLLKGQVPEKPTDCSSDCSVAQSRAYAAYTGRKYKQAVANYRIAAAGGEKEAMNALGALYAGGNGVPSDADRANAWFYLGAVHGSLYAMRNLASSYMVGRGFDTNPERAGHWLLQAIIASSNKAVEMAARYHRQQDNRPGAYIRERNCLRHPSRSEAFRNDLAAIQGPDWRLAAVQRGNPFRGGVPDLPFTLDWIAETTGKLHRDLSSCGLFDMANNRALNGWTLSIKFIDDDTAFAAATALVTAAPLEEIHWIDFARLARRESHRLAADAWNRVWALINSYQGDAKLARIHRLQTNFRFRFTGEVFKEIAKLNLSVGDFESAYFYASRIYADEAFETADRPPDADWLMLATGFASAGLQGMNQARRLVENWAVRARTTPAWHKRIAEEEKARFNRKSPCRRGGRPNVESVMLVEAMRVLGRVAYRETRSEFAKYELLQLLAWAQDSRDSRTGGMKYAQRYTCLSRFDRSEPDYKDSGERAKKKLAKLPIRKLSRVGQLLMAQGQAAIARGDLETARHSFYAVAYGYEPWYPPAWYNFAMVTVAGGGLRQFEVDHLRKYLALGASGPGVEIARDLIARWEPAIRDAKRAGRCTRGSICPDRKVIEYDHSDSGSDSGSGTSNDFPGDEVLND